MTDKTQNLNHLADLFRAIDPCGVDPDTLARFAAGELGASDEARVAARLTAAPEASEIVALLRDLAPDSARFAAAVDAVCGSHRRPDHHRDARPAPRRAVGHHARHRRGPGLRWLGAAAVLALAFGLWGWHHVDTRMARPAVAAAASAASKAPDTIFDSGLDGRIAKSPTSDQIFHGSFNS